MDGTPSIQQDVVDFLQQRQEHVATRHAVLEALGKQPVLTDVDLASETGRDIETIRETVRELADWHMIELTEAPGDRRMRRSTETPAVTCRLTAI